MRSSKLKTFKRCAILSRSPTLPNNSSFTLPAEWEKQSGVLITWPHEHSDWSGNLVSIENLYIDLSKAISQHEKLLIIAYDDALKDHIEHLLSKHHIALFQVIITIEKTNDTWTRDYGPISLSANGDNRLLDFQFNGWGNKYPANLDNQLTQRLLQKQILLPLASQKQHFTLEGGSIESDGAGTLLTTTSCLLESARNPTLSKHDIECLLIKKLGMKKVLWLNHGYLAGDDTDSHIDVLARFTDKQTIVYVKCNDPEDEHYDSSCLMEAELTAFTNAQDEPYRLISLPFPNAIYDEDNRRLPASYANFLIINNAVLVPTYDDAQDEITLSILQQCFQDRKIIAIPFNAAIQQNGSLHCLTMQLPEGLL